ncbi:hypothetical protein E3N88_33052 [Mikania micrantha]|uniref:DUF668 domain-containing protein n=1 Tax=Mikania micrantha TaxID=192012 RepID=A0A5N6MAQ0_9ASTR|nr:hypothetical protein E3N88_33052 [Mikania micrantha]
MGIDTIKESSWFTSMWRPSRKTAVSDPEKPVIGIMSFEVARLMTKLANLWQILSDKQMSRLQEELTNSLGTQNLVSDNQDYLMELALIEIIDNIKCVAKSVSRLGKRCADPVYHSLDNVFDNHIEINVNWRGWEYKLKKMEKRVKKMKRFAAVTLQLSEELEVLSELENGLKRIQDNNSDKVKLNEFEKRSCGNVKKSTDCQRVVKMVKKPTLGDAALALHYANVIIFIERLAISPYFISPELREDLYHMLTTTIRKSLKEKLSFEPKNDYNGDIASDWGSSMQKTLNWLVPLAQNMIKWHSERNFEKQIMGSGGNVLLIVMIICFMITLYDWFLV